MKAITGILLLALVAFAATQQSEESLEAQFSIRCFHTIDWRFFDLKPLMKE